MLPFFAVRGGSLSSAVLIGSVPEMAGVEIDIVDLFENPTNAQQSALSLETTAETSRLARRR